MLLSDQLQNDALYQLVGDCKNNIRLVMPTISAANADKILSVRRKEAKIDFVTGYEIADIFYHRTDLVALKNIIQSEGKIYGIPGLQGSFNLFDDNYAMVFSGPIAREGFGAQKNYGVLVDNREVINSLQKDFGDLIKPDNSKIIDLDRLKEMNLALEKLTGTRSEFVWDTNRIIKALGLSGWTVEVFDCLTLIPNEVFYLAEVYNFESSLAEKYPFNHHIQAKIRQQLQVLRDKGLVEFLGRGKYRKLPGLQGW